MRDLFEAIIFYGFCTRLKADMAALKNHLTDAVSLTGLGFNVFFKAWKNIYYFLKRCSVCVAMQFHNSFSKPRSKSLPSYFVDEHADEFQISV